MTIIRVDPDILNQCANRMNGVQNGINQISRNVINAGNSAPSYEGQFGPRIRSICGDAGYRARTLADKEGELSGSLHNRAGAFSNADMTSLQRWSMTNQTLKLWQEAAQWLPKWGWKEFLRGSGFERFLNLGWLLFPGTWPAISIVYLAQLGYGWKIGSVFSGIHLPWFINPRPKTDPSPEQPSGPVPGTTTGSTPQPTNLPLSIGGTQNQPPNGIKTVLGPVNGMAPAVSSNGSPSVTNEYLVKNHTGIDIADPTGSTIQASYKGKVIFAKEVNAGQLNPKTEDELAAIKRDLSKNYGYGNAMIVEYKFEDQTHEVQQLWKEKYEMDNGQSVYGLYGHLEKIYVNSGDVELGSAIAKMGTDGNSTGIHLHLDFKVDKSGIGSGGSGFPLASFSTLSKRVDPGSIEGIKP